jgi:nucleoside-diphosphate-sugar epimerase
MDIAVIGGSGYIGSYLCKNLPACPDPIDVSKFKYVIYLGGISKRGVCNDSWEFAYHKNVTEVVNFVKKLDPDHQIFIYSSTGAICMDKHEEMDNYTKSMLKREQEINKLQIRSVGLRLAGVVGRSPNMRMDLIYHAMIEKALKREPIQVYNPETRRGVLWLYDLLEAIRCIISKPIAEFQMNKIYELCSFNTTVIDIARDISDATDMPYQIVETKNTIPGFKLDSTPFCNEFGFQFKGTRVSVIKDLVDITAFAL